VTEGWDNKKGIFAPEDDAVVKRARDARLWLREVTSKAGGEEVHVAIVTHGGLLHYITEDFTGMDPAIGKFDVSTFLRDQILEPKERRTDRFQERVGRIPNIESMSSRT